MGRYIVDKIPWMGKEWDVEDLISHGFQSAQRHPDVTIEIAGHILAHSKNDDTLFNIGLDLMREGGSPCHFTANENAGQATTDNNRPSVSPLPKTHEANFHGTEEWDDCLDGIFDKKVKPWEIKKAIENVSSEKIHDRRFYYVSYRILKVINWIPVGIPESQYLRWINYHFECGWERNKNQKKAFLFNLEGTVRKLDDLHPSKWKDNTLYSDLGKHYRLLALSFKNAFTQTVINGTVVDDSDSFEHLKDRPVFLRGAKLVFDRWMVPDGTSINNGK